MALEDDLKARTSALISQQMASWVVEIQRSIQGHQASLVRALDELGEDVARYDEKIDDGQIGRAIAEVLQQAGAAAGPADYSDLKASIAVIEKGANLSEVLTHLVNEVAHFVERAAMFIVKAQNAVGWYGTGVANPEVVKTISIPLSADTLFRLAASSRRAERGHISQSPGTGQALARLGGRPGGILVLPLILRDKVAAILYCDTTADEVAPAAADAAEILVAFAGKVIDVLSGAPRTGTTSPGMRSSPPAPARAAAAAPAPASESPQTVMFGTGTMKPRPAPQVARPPTSPPVRAVAPAAPPPAPAAPPMRAMTPEQQKAHDDARRFARLVVSEIKLYNEAKVAEGRKTKDIYERLKEDIERGRQMYNDRVAADIRDATDYFQDELVRILGGGDASALGS